MDRGEVWLVDLEPTEGHEQQGERCVVILSPANFNRATGVPIVVPVTIGGNLARVQGFAVNLIGLGLRTQGIVRCDQPRAMDLRARGARRTGERLPDSVMDDVLARVATLFE